MSTKKKLRPNQAKVQFLAHKEEIFELMEKGYSLVETLEIMTESKKLTMTYQTLRGYVEKYKNLKTDSKNLIPQKNETKVGSENETSSEPKVFKAEENKFKKDIDYDSLI